ELLRPLQRSRQRRYIGDSDPNIKRAHVIRGKGEVRSGCALRRSIERPGVFQLTARSADLGVQRNWLTLANRGAFCTRNSGSRERSRRGRSRRHGRALTLTQVEHETHRSLEAVQLVVGWNIDATGRIVRQTVSWIPRPEAACVQAQSEMITEVKLHAAAIIQSNLQVVIEVG